MKKSKRRRLWRICFWLFMLGGTLWIVFAPHPPKPTLPSVQVKVTQQVEAPVVAPVLEPPAPPLGDERAQPSLAFAVPPAQEVPAPINHKPRIAIVIDDVGLDIKGSQRAIQLPAYVTLSFMPYASRLKQQTQEARDKGHELMLHMPMEPWGHDDPGPDALLVGLPPEQLRERFDTALASFVGFDGVNNHMGSKFTSDPDGMEIVADELQQRHLFFLDSRTSPKTVGESIARAHGVPTLGRDVFLDDDLSPALIKGQLTQAEHIAKRKGYAVAIGHPHTTTLQALEEWLPEAEAKGFELVPVRDLLSP